MSQKILFEKLVPEGKAMGFWHDKAVFAIGPLPGETGEVAITREKSTWAEVSLRRIINPSEHRNDPKEDHYLSCSPWQGVAYDYQCTLKQQMLAEIFSQPQLKLDIANFYGAEKTFGYRNKLEFSVHKFDDNYQLAFHERGRFDAFLAASEGCVLASEQMNNAAIAVLEALDVIAMSPFIETITVRQSISTGDVIVVVCVTKQVIDQDWAEIKLLDGLKGLRIVVKIKHNEYKTLYLAGHTDLDEIVGGVNMKYPWDSFFQVNKPMFELALRDIRTAISAKAKVLDMYGGAGSIGLALAQDGHEVTGVELIKASVELANDNATTAGLNNYHAVCAPAEKISSNSFSGIETVIVDPPRAGLHKDVVNMLLEVTPKQIVYLSCNPITQARDLNLLQHKYSISPATGYDFYPGTLHLESLVILELKSI